VAVASLSGEFVGVGGVLGVWISNLVLSRLGGMLVGRRSLHSNGRKLQNAVFV
jgi:hypothetical protein